MTGYETTDESGQAAVGSIALAPGAAGLDHWCFGGWGVDLWVGRVTRPH